MIDYTALGGDHFRMRKRNMQGKYGMVTMCVGTGQGAAGIFEFLN